MTEALEELSVVGLDAQGRGVAEGGAIVPGALPGERARVNLSDRRAELVEILAPSGERAKPFCPWFGRCGGCAAQHMSEDLYRGWKRGLVVDALKRAGVEAEVGPLIDAHGQGRRRAAFHARFPHGAPDEVGFMRARSHDIISIDVCPLFAPSMVGAVPAARALAGDLRGLMKPLDISVTATLDGLDVDLRGSGPLAFPETRKLIRTAEALDLARVANHGAVVIERRAPRVAFGEALVVLPPGGFLQATEAGEEELANFAEAALSGAKRIADLFCGTGAFALRLAGTHDVFAADSDAAAIGALRKGAAGAPALRPVVAETRDLFRRPLSAVELAAFDAALFDPPRAGAEAQARAFAESGLRRVVAISCNADTFARDARILVDGGFRIGQVTPLDQFRYSPHVEIAAVFHREGAKKLARRLLQVIATKREAALAAFEAILGPRHVLTDPTLIAGSLVEPRGLYHGKALALLRPASTQEVAAVVGFCNEARIGIVPQGGNTGLVGGQTPDESGDQIILSTQRLKAIREVDPHANVMICEAGVTLAEAQAAALSADRLFPLSVAAEGTCTIGGNVSTNAGGVTVIAYGNTRDLVTGVEAVLADGRIVHGLSKLRKDNTGYDVKGLFVGAEGTLGIVTAASLRLFPNPARGETAFVGLASPEKALDLLALARERLGAGVTSFELIGRAAYDITLAHGLARAPLQDAYPWYVLVEASSQIPGGFDEAFAGALEAALEGGIVEDASIASSLEQRHAFWKLRESIPEAQNREGGSIKHDVSVAVGDTPRFIAEATRAVGAFLPGSRVVCFGHLGDGNMHFNVSQPIGEDKAEFVSRWDAMNEVVHGVVAKLGGSFSAEHGVGRLKRGLLAQTKDPASLAAMRAIKAALDPKGVMNPGKVV